MNEKVKKMIDKCKEPKVMAAISTFGLTIGILMLTYQCGVYRGAAVMEANFLDQIIEVAKTLPDPT